MKLFCSYAFTGEDVTAVEKRMTSVVDALTQAGHEAYCPLFDPYKIALQEKHAINEIFEYDFRNIATCEAMVAIITSSKKSEGQLMEIGALLAQHKPLYLFMHESALHTSHLPKLTPRVFPWQTDTDLKKALVLVQP